MNKRTLSALAAVLLCVTLAGCDATPLNTTNNLRANVLGIATARTEPPTAEAQPTATLAPVATESAQAKEIQNTPPQTAAAGTVADAFDLDDALHGDARRGAAMAVLMALASIAGVFGLGYAISNRAHRSAAHE